MGLGRIILDIFSLFAAGRQAEITDEQWDKFQQATDQQISDLKLGFSNREIRAMKMVASNPQSEESEQIIRDLATRLPQEARAQLERVGQEYTARRGQFLGDYDTRFGAYLDRNDADTAKLIADYEKRTGGLAQGFGQREADVMALLEGQGNQALRDTERVFGEEEAAAIGDLSSRGLAGSGVGSSIRGGFATRKGDELARIRERVGAQKADALSGLRGDTLGFGERTSAFGAGLGESGISRRLGAGLGVEGQRAGFDYNLSGDTQAAKERAWLQAMGYDQSANQNLSSWLDEDFRQQLETYLRTTGESLESLSNTNFVPPDRSSANTWATAAGTRWGNWPS